MHIAAALSITVGTVWLTSDTSVPMESRTGSSSKGSNPEKYVPPLSSPAAPLIRAAKSSSSFVYSGVGICHIA